MGGHPRYKVAGHGRFGELHGFSLIEGSKFFAWSPRYRTSEVTRDDCITMAMFTPLQSTSILKPVQN